MDLDLYIFRIRNWADLEEFPPVVLPLSPDRALQHIADVVQTLPRWRVEASDPAQGTMHLTRRTAVFCFVDDIRLRLVPVEGGTRLHGRSQSRVGLSDLGQNGRNLRDLVAALASRAASAAG